MSRKIAVIGPESSGNTTLCRALSKHFKASMVEEYARNYLQKKGLNYEQKDLDEIAKGQAELESKAMKKNPDFLFCDTNILVIKKWSEIKYGHCSSTIEQLYQQFTYDLSLLLRPDLPYEKDPLRESPGLLERKIIFHEMEKELLQTKTNFRVVSGLGKNRLKNAIGFISNQNFL